MRADDARFLRDLFRLARGDRRLAFFADQLGVHQGLPEKLALACVARLEAGGLIKAVPVRGRAPLIRITEKGAREARDGATVA